MRTINKGWITRAALPVMLLALLVSGCNKLEQDTTAAAYLVVSSITGNDLGGQAGSTVIYSDVVTNESIFNDVAVAVLEAHAFDPFDANITTYKDIIVERVDIEFTRTDGLNTQGVDVPYAFSQDVNVLVTTEGQSSELSFTIITHNAKMESPLVGLTNLGGEKILKLEAHCTFYGRTVSGHEIAPVTHTVSVWCANFADAEGA